MSHSSKPLLVLKVGTSTLIASDQDGHRVQLANVASLVELIVTLKREGHDVVLVSSGAVGMGCIKLGIEKPKVLQIKQAVAAAGQSQLMRLYEDLFSTMRTHVAQLLISQKDFLDKEHWGNIKNTILQSLNLGLVPIINENDSTNTPELRFGDNDNLAAVTAVQLKADALFLFSDVDFLYTANPRSDPAATPIRVVAEPWALQVDTGLGSDLGTGGMATKIVAARTASTAGIPVGLINGCEAFRIHTFLRYMKQLTSNTSNPEPPEGTFFMAMKTNKAVSDTRRWIVSLPASGEVMLDDGAAQAMADKKSLFPSGIRGITGHFLRNEAVRLVHCGSEIGRAIINYSSDELEKVKGQQSSEFEQLLGYPCDPEACHRGNIMLTTDEALIREEVAKGTPQLRSQSVH